VSSAPFAVAFLTLLALCGAVPARESLPSRSGLRPDAASLGPYLAGLVAADAERREIDGHVRRLGAAERGERDSAAERLAALGCRAVAQLARAAASDDPETRRAATRLLDRATAEVDREVFTAVLEVIRQRPVRGVAAAVVAVAPLAAQLSLLDRVHAALASAVEPGDAPAAEAQLAADDAILRGAALVAFAAAMPEDRLDAVSAQLDAPQPHVVLAAAWSLTNRGRHDGLPALARLLACDDDWVRRRAVQTLRMVSSKTFGFSENLRPSRQPETIEAWRKWVVVAGEDAEWSVPLPGWALQRGVTLISFYNENRAIEIDSGKFVVWECRLPGPWACVGGPGGRRAIVSYEQRELRVYDSRGVESLRKDGLPGHVGGMDLLPGGNVVVACTDGDHLVEIDPRGNIVWTVECKGNPTDVRVLPDGKLLVTLCNAGKVVRMNRRGETEWEIGGLQTPYSASPTDAGTILVVSSGPTNRVAEYTWNRKQTWAFDAMGGCYSAQRLPNGNYLLADESGVHEITPAEEVVWTYPAPGLKRAHRS
jgi:hypothetical protein